MTKLTEALRQRFKTPREALAALGLDAALLSEDTEMRLSQDTASRIAKALREKNKLAQDVSIEDVTTLIGALQGAEAGHDETGTDPNAGLPSYMREEEDDADDETEEEREEDEGYDRRADDARKRLGRDETEEEREDREEREADDAFKNITLDARRNADDRRMRRADDARRRMGRDETEEEREERERRDEVEDRMRGRDRRRMGRDYRRARDAHRTARDAHRRFADDWRRARDAHKKAMDERRADDARKYADDMKRADVACRDARDRMGKARDARHRARDMRRAHDRMYGRDEPSWFPGRPNTGGSMEPMTKQAADAMIQERVDAAIRENDRRHRAVNEALAAVRPRVGELAMDAATSTAADVYSRGLKILGVPHDGIRDEAALKAMYGLAARQVSSEDARRRQDILAQDAAVASTAGFDERYPGVRTRYQH